MQKCYRWRYQLCRYFFRTDEYISIVTVSKINIETSESVSFKFT